jgi:hypothetical protein
MVEGESYVVSEHVLSVEIDIESREKLVSGFFSSLSFHPLGSDCDIVAMER